MISIVQAVHPLRQALRWKGCLRSPDEWLKAGYFVLIAPIEEFHKRTNPAASAKTISTDDDCNWVLRLAIHPALDAPPDNGKRRLKPSDERYETGLFPPASLIEQDEPAA
jgi:hypothetical protein